MIFWLTEKKKDKTVEPKVSPAFNYIILEDCC